MDVSTWVRNSPHNIYKTIQSALLSPFFLLHKVFLSLLNHQLLINDHLLKINFPSFLSPLSPPYAGLLFIFPYYLPPSTCYISHIYYIHLFIVCLLPQHVNCTVMDSFFFFTLSILFANVSQHPWPWSSDSRVSINMCWNNYVDSPS